MRRDQASGQVHLRDAPKEALRALHTVVNGIGGSSEGSILWGNPTDYSWRYIGKQDFLVPYNRDLANLCADDSHSPEFPDCKFIRWEQKLVWIVEGTLNPGESNILPRRRFYIDIRTPGVLFGEGYDFSGALVKCYILFDHPFPAPDNQNGQWYSAAIVDNA